MRKLASLISLFVLLSCVSTTPVKPKEVTLPPIEVISDSPLPEYGVTFSPVEKYSTVKQRELIQKASVKMRETVVSACFKNYMINRKMKATNGKTSLQVYDHIMGMKADVPVKMYYRKYGSCLSCTSAVAYRQPPEKSINLNYDFFDESKSTCRWAQTLAHEALGHALGEYGHTSKWYPSREYTVPYSIGGAKDSYGGSAFSHCCKD